MTTFSRNMRRLAISFPLLFLVPLFATAQEPAAVVPARDVSPLDVLPKPATLQSAEQSWLYKGSDIPPDEAWIFGELDNGLRYAVRHNGVPPGQVSVRVRIDAGSLHERDGEQGYAHFLEHLLFRESKYLGPNQAIPTWQRLGATFGSDTNAETSPTQTVYKLDLPNASDVGLVESFKLLSGMIREPVLSPANVAAERPIILAERRERGGAAMRAAEKVRETLFTGQPLANRLPIGTEATLQGATAKGLSAFHQRWYRPENTVVVVVGDAEPTKMAALIERSFADWRGAGEPVGAPSFGKPKAPAKAVGTPPVGEAAVIVEPDLPRSLTYAVMRPWEPVVDTIVYNEGLLIDALAQALVNRRLEARARGGGSYLYAQVQQDDVSRSTDATFVSVTPLTDNWETALTDVRAVIADAMANPPSEEELQREIAEFEAVFASSVEQQSVQAGATLANNLVEAVDIRETTASPATVLAVFRGMKDKVTPARVLEQTRALFDGAVVRTTYTTPAAGEATAAALREAQGAPVAANGSSRLAANAIRFEDLEPIGEPGTIVARSKTGLFDIEQVTFANGVKAMLWANDGEPGRVTVKVRFGSGFQALNADDIAYIGLAPSALVGSGLGELGQEDLDRITTGRKMGFNLGIHDGAFSFSAQTRKDDLADQLYLFAAKLAMPRWDPNPFNRGKAAATLAYESYATSPGGVIARDLEYLLSGSDGRFATPTPQQLAKSTPEGFRKVWEPILQQGPIEVIIFGDFLGAEAVTALSRTFGALPERSSTVSGPDLGYQSLPTNDVPQILYHRGEQDQAAAVIAWPTGGGVDGVRESRQLEILVHLFNNRLLDAMREHAGASYAPNVGSTWPVDAPAGGRITGMAQLRPADVPVFFQVAGDIAADLVANPVAQDELDRVTEPLRQLIMRLSTGNNFWLMQLEGATQDPRRYALTNNLLADYSRTTPQAMQKLAAKYFQAAKAYKVAVIPEGQQLASRPPASAARPASR